MTVLRVSRWRYAVAPESKWLDTHKRQRASAVRRKEGSIVCGVEYAQPSRLADAFDDDIRSIVFLVPISNVCIPYRPIFKSFIVDTNNTSK